MDSRHPLCQHEDPCWLNSLKGFVRGAVIGIVARTLLVLVKNSLKRKIHPKHLLVIFSKENLRIVGFLTGMVGSFRVLICLFRRLFNSEKWASSLAAFFSGIPLAFEHPETRVLYSTYLLGRGLDGIVHKLVDKGILPNIPFGYRIPYMIVQSIILYAVQFESKECNRGFWQLTQQLTFSPFDKYLLDRYGVNFPNLKENDK